MPARLSDEQIRAVTTDGPLVVVRAGAGAGKTRVLTERVARLLRDGVSPAQILVVTFTRAAATEMRERLHELLDGGDLAGLRIQTLHAYAAALLREVPHVVGRSRAYTLYDARDIEDIQSAILEERVVRGVTQRTWSGACRDASRRAALEAELERRLLAWDALGYDGLITGALRTLEESASARAAHGARHVIVDEAQDTGPALWALLGAIEPQSLYLVGDERQSIYSFLGADPGRLEASAARSDARCVELADNYRSLPVIVDAANVVAAGMAGQPPPMVARRRDEPGLVVVTSCSSREARAELVAERIAGLISLGEGAGNIAVLARRWRSLEPVAAALDARRVPYLMPASDADQWHWPGARALCTVLRAALNPRDGWSARVALRELVGPGASVLEAVALRRGCRALDLDPSCARLLGAIRDARDDAPLASTAAGAALAEAYRRSGRLSLAVEVEASVLRIVAWLGTGQGTSVRDLLDWIAQRELSERVRECGDEGAVALSTIHGAKGLEWPSVHLLDWRPDGDEEEERRCWYVGATRARDALWVDYYGEPSPMAAQVQGS